MDVVLNFESESEFMDELERCPPKDGVVRFASLQRALGYPSVFGLVVVASCVCEGRLVRYSHDCGAVLVTKQGKRGVDRVSAAAFEAAEHIQVYITAAAERLGLQVLPGVIRRAVEE
ncbi:MAG: hypothetical protein IT437_04060 [Phycisphaerales bacterium]|nr:hypothetical protein [Phycisphaerales bacterium]